MGQSHINKLWAKSNGGQSAHEVTPSNSGGQDIGRSAKPSVPSSNMAGTATPVFVSKGQMPLQGSGGSGSKGPAKNWSK